MNNQNMNSNNLSNERYSNDYINSIRYSFPLRSDNLYNEPNISNLANISANMARNSANIARNLSSNSRNSTSVARGSANNYHHSNNLFNENSNRRNILTATPRITPLTNNGSVNINRFVETFFEPIEIFPSQSQLEIATRVTRYGNILRPVNTSCPISLEPFNDNDQVTMIRHCGHIFNTQEINSWFASNCRCPVCRYDIRNYMNNNENTNSQENIRSQENILNNRRTTSDTSGNEAEILTNSILNRVLNQYGLTNSGISENRVFDIFLDTSNNNLFDSATLLTGLYYLPTNRQ